MATLRDTAGNSLRDTAGNYLQDTTAASGGVAGPVLFYSYHQLQDATMIPLRKSTASQEVLLGPFLDDTDGKTAETGLTIANTDIKLWKRGGTTESNKNSGGATHIADGRYYAVLDATDTDTTGELIINVAVAGALPVRLVCCVYEAAVFDALLASGAAGYQVPIWSSASSTVNLANTTIKSVADSVTAASVTDKTGFKLASDGLAAISAWSVTITGNLNGNVSGSVNSVATTVSANVTQWNSGSLPTFPTHFGSLLINSSGHLSRVTLVDTTTTNTDMRGTDGAALASVWTSTIAGRIDMPLSDIPTAGENADAVWDEAYAGHVAAGSFGKLMDILRKANYVTDGTVASGQTPTTTVFRTNLTAPSGTYDHQTMLFLTGTLAGESKPVDTYSQTNGTFTLAEPLTSAPTVGDEFVLLPEHVHPITAIAAGVRTELAVELARIDVTVGSRLADADYTAPLDAAGTRSAIGLAAANLDTQLDAIPTAIENADALLGRSVANVESTASEHSVCTLVLAALESSVIGTSWTIKRTDGTTTHATKTVTTDASAEPITGVT